MPPHPLGSVSPAPLLLPSCHPAPGDTVSHPLMSEQAKNTVGVSEGGGCVHSGTPQSLCCTVVCIPVGHSGWLEAAGEAEGCGYHRAFTWLSWEHPEWCSCRWKSSPRGQMFSGELFEKPCLLRTIFHAPKNPVVGECYTGGWLCCFSPSRCTPGRKVVNV